MKVIKKIIFIKEYKIFVYCQYRAKKNQVANMV